MGCRTICVLHDLWGKHPPVGLWIGMLGLVGVLVPLLRDVAKLGKREKALWTSIMFALLLLEIKSVYQDRNEHDAQQKEARELETENFRTIADGIEDSIRQSRENFTGTMKRSDQIMSRVAATIKHTARIEKDTGVILADAQSTHVEIQSMLSRRNSANALVEMTSRVTAALRDMRGLWYDAIRNLELNEDEQTMYQFPPLSREQRHTEEQKWEARKESANNKMATTQQIIAKNANDLRLILLLQIPPESHTPEDDKEEKLFRQLDAASGYPNCCPEMEHAADYLDNLAQRAKAALGN